ncbi:RAxF-45 family protein [Salicibibacter cibi]|nr:RAxF-45 family protein [Salicibibacter cibi]
MYLCRALFADAVTNGTRVSCFSNCIAFNQR